MDSASQIPPRFRPLSPHGGCSIPDTALRGLSINQLRLFVTILSDLITEDGGWEVSRPDDDGGFRSVVISSHEEVNLYDANQHIISPATESRQCSMVELMTAPDAEHTPHYFVSHPWLEAVTRFLACLEQHSSDRKLESTFGTSPRYWVCAYANNQHRLEEEISDDLTQTSFHRAIMSDKTCGTLVLLDEAAISFTRIWCCYEFYQTLINRSGDGNSFTFDLYTAYDHHAISQEDQAKIYELELRINDPKLLAAVQNGRITQAEMLWDDLRYERDALAKGTLHHAVGILDGVTRPEMERYFPLDRLDKGVTFDCMDGQASVSTDAARIKASIHDSETLNRTVHSFVASRALRMALENDTWHQEHYLSALQHHLYSLHLDLRGSRVDNESVWSQVFNALPPNTLQVLNIKTHAHMTLDDSIGTFAELRELDISDCTYIHCLPSNLNRLTQLILLDMTGCTSVIALPDLRGLESVSVKYHDQSVLDLWEHAGRGYFVRQPPPGAIVYELYLAGQAETVENWTNLINALPADTLQELHITTSLKSLPQNLGRLQSLTALHLSGPDVLQRRRKLQERPDWHHRDYGAHRDHGACERLESLPESLASLSNLTTLDLYNCRSMLCLPNLSSLGSLEHVDLFGVHRRLASTWHSTGRAKVYLSDKDAMLVRNYVRAKAYLCPPGSDTDKIWKRHFCGTNDSFDCGEDEVRVVSS